MCEIIVLCDKIKHKGEGVTARDIKHSFLAVGVVPNAHSSFFLHPDAQNLMRSDLRREREREEEKKKDSSFSSWWSGSDPVRSAQKSSHNLHLLRVQEEDSDPNLKSEVCKVLAHR